MTATSRSDDRLENDLRAMYQVIPPPMELTAVIDTRVSAALQRHRTRPARSKRQIALLAASVALVAAFTLSNSAVAQRVVEQAIVIIDGIVFSDGVVGRPGLTNFGQPFWGTDIFDRTPREAEQMAAEKGYSIRWQIERRQGTESMDDDEISFSEQAPDCGAIGGGSVVDDRRIQMVVVIDDPLTPGSDC